MKFLLYSLNYAPELTGIGKYNGELCETLANCGFETEAVCAPPYYPQWRVMQGYSSFQYMSETINGVKVYRCPTYVPSTPTALKRLLHLASFALSSAGLLFTKLISRKNPNVLFLVQPTLFCAPLGLLYAKLTGAKSIMHIQDFEVDAFFGLGMGKSKQIKRAVERIECFLLRRFDLITTISHKMLEHAVHKGVSAERIVLFPNWSDTSFITPDADGSSLKTEFGFAPDDFIVLYSGNIGEKQGLEIVLDAAAAMGDRTKAKFLFVGDGAHALKLRQKAYEMGLSNCVQFEPLQPWARVPELLALADIHLVIQKRGAADVVLPSKLTNILAVGGHCIVTTDPDTELGIIAAQYPGIYRCIEPESSVALIAALKSALQEVGKNSEHNGVARKFAEQHLNKTAIIDTFCRRLRRAADSV